MKDYDSLILTHKQAISFLSGYLLHMYDIREENPSYFKNHKIRRPGVEKRILKKIHILKKELINIILIQE